MIRYFVICILGVVLMGQQWACAQQAESAKPAAGVQQVEAQDLPKPEPKAEEAAPKAEEAAPKAEEAAPKAEEAAPKAENAAPKRVVAFWMTLPGKR